MSKKFLISVVGATGIGKTALSIRLAKHFNTEIISCDSRQFYKEMSIGTAVPEPEELNAVTHHFIQDRSIHTNYSVGQFEKEALRVLETLFKKNDVVIMVGGSGLYVKAVTEGLDVFPDIDPSIREQLIKTFNTSGIAPLVAQLEALDPDSYQTIDKDNHQRVIRALEVCLGTGKPYTSFLKNKTGNRSFNTLSIGLSADREIVYKRINQRVDKMIDKGLFEEAKALYPHRELNALQTVGYKEMFQHLDGLLTMEEAIQEIKKNTRRFAKRQGTWFRKDSTIKWFDYQSDFEHIIKYLHTQFSI